MKLNFLPIKKLPKSPPIGKILGPSFILLGLGLGSGEIILWPHLTSKYGMGIIWGAVVGILLQFIMNMEIERYALVHGESVFVGFARKSKILPFWFLISTFVPWVWPGIVASSAEIIGKLIGIQSTKYISISLLVLLGLILTMGPILYRTVESIQKFLIMLGVPTVLVLSIILAKSYHWSALAQGLIGKGTDYWFLPAGLPIASFLAALAYAGAGGNLNLAQSSYVKEKGYGMGKYAGKIKSVLTGSQEEISLAGSGFETTPENLLEFKKWWKNINIEHFIIFFVMGAVTMVLLGLLSFSTTYGQTQNVAGLGFLFLEAQKIGSLLFPIAGTFFLIVAALTLLSTQLGIFDATSRIISENTILASNKLGEKSLPKVYYFVLWAQILAGVMIYTLGLNEPLQLLTIAAVLNAFAMFAHTGLTLWINLSLLQKPLHPSFGRIFGMLVAFAFYGGFSCLTILDTIQKIRH